MIASERLRIRIGAAALASVCSLALTLVSHSAEVPTGGEPSAAGEAECRPVLQLSFAGAGDQGQTVMSIAVAIYADGTVVVPDRADGAAPLRGELSGASLEKLLQAVVQTHRLLEFDTRAIEETLIHESQRTGLSWRVPGADATVLQVRWQGRDHEVRCPAATLLEARFPGIVELHRVCAVQRRLQNVKCVVEAGGIDAAERLVALANRELRSGAGDRLTVSVDDLQLVRLSGDGLCYSQFVLLGDAAAGDPSVRMVSVIESPGAAPQVSVMQVPPSRP